MKVVRLKPLCKAPRSGGMNLARRCDEFSPALLRREPMLILPRVARATPEFRRRSRDAGFDETANRAQKHTAKLTEPLRGD